MFTSTEWIMLYSFSLNSFKPYKACKKTIKYWVGSIEIRQKCSNILKETYLKSGNQIFLSAKIYFQN